MQEIMSPSLFAKHLREATTKEKALEVINLWKDKANSLSEYSFIRNMAVALELLRRKFFIRCTQCGFRLRGENHNDGHHHQNRNRKNIIQVRLEKQRKKSNDV